MKKVFFLVVIFVGITMLIVAADFRRLPGLIEHSPRERSCVGYTIIEYDKGIDCDGDTIRLTRKNGFAQVSR